jgi:transposase
MAKRQRRSYSDDYKRQAVDVVLSSGRSAKSVSKELGLDGSVLSRWVAERGAVRAGGSAAAPTTQAALPSADQADVIARLQRENEQLRMERDILKKSIAIFAGPRT